MTDETTATVTPVVQPEGTDAQTTPINVDEIYTKDELVLHNRDGDLWIAIDGVVYDLTKFSGEHPGGTKILVGVAGTDASKKFRKYHGDNILQRYAQDYRIGTLKVEAQARKSKVGLFSRLKREKK
ncbi:cytochrome b5-like heme/steroid binding domain-containing protein [Aspergillus lucknowensis]|uniref:Cytochrome b5-like heme/steroid binding domain-containing protein n=1 Tax=Aspergillus lucknowensis TaxID=176173 RepID=A0ABR4LT96_9EURO